jgi:ribonuclease J
MVLAGGTQAERNSALRRLSLGTHQALSLEAGDTVILSSRVIPGNERPVINMVNDLLRAGIIVHSRITEPGVHTSGHAGRSEQQRMIELSKPRCFLPVHGTLHHLLRHAELARSLGVQHTAVVENGTPVVFDGETLTEDAPVVHGKIPIALGGEPLDRETLQARTELSRSGVALLSLVLDHKGATVVPPQVTTRGVPAVDDQPSALRGIALEAARAVATYRHEGPLGLEDFVRRVVRKKLEDLSGTRPVIEISVARIDD